MKITSLKLKDYQQFGDLELDFTYPTDHPKAGQPLQKVCFIGANGTGKTTIMEVLIRYLNSNQLEILRYEDELMDRKGKNPFSLLNLPELINPSPNAKFKVDSQIYNSKNNPLYYFPDDKFQYNKKLYTGKMTHNNLSNFEVKVISDKDATKLDLIQIVGNMYKEYLIKIGNWIVEKKQSPELQEPVDDISPIFEWFSNFIPNLNFRYSEFVKGDEPYKYNSTINFKINETSEIISINDLSSGTRQLMYKLLPLYFEKDNLNDTFLFIDQPEDALFPNLQKEIVDIYTSLGQNNQYFFATHSPLIAGQFEPCEIFPLDFGSDGKVILREKPNGSIGWSSDEFLEHWFKTNPRNNPEQYYKLLDEFYDLMKIENRSEEEEKRAIEIHNNPMLSNYF
jgi:AAA domain, putative AbiEii toxin, Type IV TA system